MAKEMLVYPIGSFGEVFDVLAQRIVEQGSEVHILGVGSTGSWSRMDGPPAWRWS